MDIEILAEAIAATFSRRETIIPTELPVGLTDEFATDVSLQNMWLAFLKKNELKLAPLTEVVTTLGKTLQLAIARAVNMKLSC